MSTSCPIDNVTNSSYDIRYAGKTRSGITDYRFIAWILISSDDTVSYSYETPLGGLGRMRATLVWDGIMQVCVDLQPIPCWRLKCTARFLFGRAEYFPMTDEEKWKAAGVAVAQCACFVLYYIFFVS